MGPCVVKAGVYTITNTANGKLYVGSTVNLAHRWRQHRRLLSKGTHHSIKLQRAWNKYSADAFEFRVLETCSHGLLIPYEQMYIKYFRPWYNMCPVAGSRLGCKASPETIIKMSKAHTGVPRAPFTTAHRAALAAVARLRAPISAATRARMLVASTGRRMSEANIAVLVARNTGRLVSEATRAKQSAAGKQRPPISDENRAGMSARMLGNKICIGNKNHLGKKHSPEARAKMSANRKGLCTGPLSEEHKAKISEAKKGLRHSDETRSKMSIAHLKRSRK